MEQAGQKVEPSNSGTQAVFGNTRWTDIINPGANGDPKALEELCRSYWPPLYAFLRRSGNSPHDAQDMVQGFFAHLLAKDSRLQSAHPSKGRFRSFLLACLKHYAANRRAWDAVRSPKEPLISIDEEQAEERYHHEPADVTDPALLFERQWAATVVEQVASRLREIWTNDGKADLFDALAPYLNGESERGDYAIIATKVGMNEGAVRTAVTRLRQEYRKLLLKEISRTVEDPSEVEDELRALFAIFAC